MPSLLIGRGNSRLKKVALHGAASFVEPLVTLDMNPNCGADFVHDLDNRWTVIWMRSGDEPDVWKAALYSAGGDIMEVVPFRARAAARLYVRERNAT